MVGDPLVVVVFVVVEDVLDGDHVVVAIVVVALLVVEAVGNWLQMVELEAVIGISAGGEVEHVA